MRERTFQVFADLYRDFEGTCRPNFQPDFGPIGIVTMMVRSTMALMVSGAMFVALPLRAQDLISPYNVLSGKSATGFADRTARITSIMGPESDGVTRLVIPTKPHWQRTSRRDAAASSGLR